MLLGLLAKLVDVPELNGTFPLFDEVFGRFGVWIFAATLLAVFSFTPVHASIRVFGFFLSMLVTYYVYTVLFLGFFPKSQIVLWGVVSLLSPVCAAVIWRAGEDGWIADVLAALPIAALCTEWYVTAGENLLLLAVYLILAALLLVYVPKERKRCLPIVLLAAAMTFVLLKTGWMAVLYGELLNV